MIIDLSLYIERCKRSAAKAPFGRQEGRAGITAEQQPAGSAVSHRSLRPLFFNRSQRDGVWAITLVVLKPSELHKKCTLMVGCLALRQAATPDVKDRARIYS